MIISNTLAFALVDDPDFIDALSEVSDNKFVTFGRTKLTNMVDDMYKDMVDTVNKQVHNSVISHASEC